MKERNPFDLLRDEQGTSLIELALIFPLFVLLLLGAVDFGRAYYLAIEVAGAAHAGAVYGSQHPTDTAGMQNAAQDDAPNVPNLSVPTPTYGCECADGSNYSANCSTAPTSICSSINLNVVNRVNVTVNATYTPLLPWPGWHSSTTLTSSASMRSAGS
jgi:Flp pilus assembly protein TadG